MELVRNGEMGVLVNKDDIAKLTTPNVIEDEIDRITLGDYEPVYRDHDTVVAPEEYIKYLNGLLATVKAKLDKSPKQAVVVAVPDQPMPADQTDTTSEQPMPSNNIPVSDEHGPDVEAALYRRDQIIEQLLEVAKNKQKRAKDAEAKLESVLAETAEPVYYEGSVPENADLATASIKPPLSEILRIIYGDHKISLFANIAIARGLLGDTRAETLIDSMYDEGTYSKFIEALKGDKTVDNSAEPELSESDTE